jgi:hypothetical protein
MRIQCLLGWFVVSSIHMWLIGRKADRDENWGWRLWWLNGKPRTNQIKPHDQEPVNCRLHVLFCLLKKLADHNNLFVFPIMWWWCTCICKPWSSRTLLQFTWEYGLHRWNWYYCVILITWMRLENTDELVNCKHNKRIYRVKERNPCGWWPMKHYLIVVSNYNDHRIVINAIHEWSIAEFMVILIIWMKVLKCGWNWKCNKHTWGWKKDIDETWMTVIAIELMDEIHHINVTSHVDETIWTMVTFPFMNKSLYLT